MLQKTFELQASAPENGILQLELGKNHITLTTFSADNIASGQLEHFNFKEQDKKDYGTLLQQLKTDSTILLSAGSHQKVILCWETDLVQPIPDPLFKPGHLADYFRYYKESIDKDPADFEHLTDAGAGYQFVYSVPKALFDLIQKDFARASHRHKQAAIARQLGGFTDTYPLKALLIFYQDHYILTTFASERLQLIISRPFNHGADVVYHLLSAIKEAGYHTDQCCVYLSGLIDGDSALFKEIYKFVPVIDVDKMEHMQSLSAHPDYPSHFFVPFYKYVR
jgi:hypothetical protein